MDAEPKDTQGGSRSSDDATAREAARHEALGRLAAGAAHDMNNVLGVILGYVELARLQLDLDPEKARAHLDNALLTVDRVREITDGMLDHVEESSRPALGDLNAVVRQVGALVRAGSDARVDLDLALADGIDAAPLDDAALRVCVMALCLEALARMPEGGRLAVRTFMETGLPDFGDARAGTYLVCEVADTGLLDEARPLAQTEQLQRLAGRHGGGTSRQTAADGEVTRMYLPSALAAGDVESAQAPSADGVDILIVDDEAPVRDVLRGFLEIEGYRIAEVGTASEALAYLRERPGGVQVVFLDHFLPDVLGADLAWQIQALPGAPKVVLLTGMADPETLRGLPAGATVFHKPFLYAELKVLLHERLQVVPTGSTT